jgi:hypothetical protein
LLRGSPASAPPPVVSGRASSRYNKASLTANILMTGTYTTGDFQPNPDNGTGTLIKFV